MAVCAAGGEKEVGILASAIRLARKKDGKDIEVKEITLERQCDPEYIEQIEGFVTTIRPCFRSPVAWASSTSPNDTRMFRRSRGWTRTSWEDPKSRESGPRSARVAGIVSSI